MILIVRRAISAVVALTVTGLGLAGAYSYGQSYSQHRGFDTVIKIPRAGTGRLLNVNFYSPALHRRAYYLTYLPPGYTPHRRYPVLYLLHGSPGRPQVFITIANLDVRLDNQLSEHRVQPMIMVFPDGRIGGSTYSDSEWANTEAGAYESYVTDVVNNVDHRFSTLADRQDRVIGGFSAGGYGAINVALHQLRTFGSVEVWSGYFVQTRTGVFAHADRADLRANSPLYYVGGLRRKIAAHPVRIYMFVGRDDGSSAQIVPMARALRRAGARVRYAIYPGGHDWQVWYPRLNQMLVLASHDFATRLPRRSRSPRRSHLPARSRAGVGSLPTPPSPVATQAPVRHRHDPPLVAALLLALLSSAAINLGFLLQHRGLADRAGDDVPLLQAMLRSRTWLAGQAIGWAGFIAQLVAVALAPLSLVQAFAAAGLAVSLPLAARAFGYRVTGRQLVAILLIGAGLASLPIALRSHSHLHTHTLVQACLLALSAAAALGLAGRASARAIAGGMFYGVADAAIKAASIGWHGHVAALLSGWTLLAAVATFCGFLCFQAALRRGTAVTSISLMNVSATLVALVLGVIAFGESLGATPLATVVHLLAIAVVLACVPVLATGQEQISEGTAVATPRRTRAAALRQSALGVAAIASLLASVLVGAGLLYGLRGVDLIAAGPRIGDALPLLALAGFDGQPLARVIVAFLGAGAVFGAALIRTAPMRRAGVAGVAGLVMLLAASDAAFAVTRNLRIDPILWHRPPTIGCWLEAVALAIGAALPRDRRRRPGRTAAQTSPTRAGSAARSTPVRAPTG